MSYEACICARWIPADNDVAYKANFLSIAMLVVRKIIQIRRILFIILYTMYILIYLSLFALKSIKNTIFSLYNILLKYSEYILKIYRNKNILKIYSKTKYSHNAKRYIKLFNIVIYCVEKMNMLHNLHIKVIGTKQTTLNDFFSYLIQLIFKLPRLQVPG